MGTIAFSLLLQKSLGFQKSRKYPARVVLPCRPSPQFINSATTHAPRRRRRQPFYEGLIRNFVQERLSLLGIILTCNIFVTGREEEEEEESTRRSRKELFPKTVSPAAMQQPVSRPAFMAPRSLVRCLVCSREKSGRLGGPRKRRGRGGAQFKGQLLSRFVSRQFSLVNSASIAKFHFGDSESAANSPGDIVK